MIPAAACALLHNTDTQGVQPAKERTAQRSPLGMDAPWSLQAPKLLIWCVVYAAAEQLVLLTGSLSLFPSCRLALEGVVLAWVVVIQTRTPEHATRPCLPRETYNEFYLHGGGQLDCG